MKIAIVGAGIAGMVAAYLLAPDHEITVNQERYGTINDLENLE